MHNITKELIELEDAIKKFKIPYDEAMKRIPLYWLIRSGYVGELKTDHDHLSDFLINSAGYLKGHVAVEIREAAIKTLDTLLKAMHAKETRIKSKLQEEYMNNIMEGIPTNWKVVIEEIAKTNSKLETIETLMDFHQKMSQPPSRVAFANYLEKVKVCIKPRLSDLHGDHPDMSDPSIAKVIRTKHRMDRSLER
jgi:hypothetical protein